jgi:hypothetical protein
MNVFAYCAASFRPVVARAAGVVSPATCPPVTMETFDPSLLAGRDLVWFKLHGRRGERYWYGDHHTTALSADQLAPADGSAGPDLSGAVVFVANCWLADDGGAPGPMLHALTRTNPRAIIGGCGPNYAVAHRIGGVDLLGLYLRALLQIGFAPASALRLAKLRLRLRRPDRATADTLGFRLWRPRALVGGGPEGRAQRPPPASRPPSNGARRPRQRADVQTFQRPNEEVP